MSYADEFDAAPVEAAVRSMLGSEHEVTRRNGDRIVVRYALDMTASQATITETIGGLPVNTLFTGTSLAAVSEFVTLLDDVL